MIQLRKGMWVVTTLGLGILTADNTVDIVDVNTSFTTATIRVMDEEMRQAFYEEIPQVRRQRSKEWFLSKGYLSTEGDV